MINEKSNLIVLVTGGAGYIGSITTKALLDAGFAVVVVDTLEKGHKEAVDQRAIFELADVGDKATMDQVIKKHKPIAVIDFAAYIAVGESMTEPKKYFANNVTNFVNLLDVLVDNKVKFLIKSSTAAVYGTPQHDADLPLREEYTETHTPSESALLAGAWDSENVINNSFFDKIINHHRETFESRSELQLSNTDLDKLKIPPSIYGLTKLLDEIIMKKYDDSFGLKSMALRYFNVAGADPSGEIGQDNENPTHIFASAIFQALGKKDKLMVFGHDYKTKDGTGVRDYVHVCDLASGHIAALKYLVQSGKSDTINLGTGIGYSVLDVISAVEKASGKKISYELGERRSGDVAILYANPSKAAEILGWTAQYSINDMATSAWKWHSTHPNGYTTQG